MHLAWEFACEPTYNTDRHFNQSHRQVQNERDAATARTDAAEDSPAERVIKLNTVRKRVWDNTNISTSSRGTEDSKNGASDGGCTYPTIQITMPIRVSNKLRTMKGSPRRNPIGRHAMLTVSLITDATIEAAQLLLLFDSFLTSVISSSFAVQCSTVSAQHRRRKSDHNVSNKALNEAAGTAPT